MRAFTSWSGVFILSSLLWLVSAMGIIEGRPTDFSRALEAIFFSLVFWLLCFGIAKKIWIGIVVSLPLVLLWPLELWTRLVFFAPISLNIVGIVFETNWAEGANFISAYGAKLAAVYALWLAFYGFVICLSITERLVWPGRLRLILLVALPAILLFSYCVWPKPGEQTEQSTIFDGEGFPGWGNQWKDVFPVNIFLAIGEYRSQLKEAEVRGRQFEKAKFGARLVDAKSAPQIVVLVIGESSSASHWSLLGYEKVTTPLLEKERNLVAFRDVASLSTATRTAVPGVLSRKPILTAVGNVEQIPESSILKVYEEAGYQTHWISNQAAIGKHDTSISIYAREAQDVKFLNPSTFNHPGSLDEVLLKPLASILEIPGRHFIVLHMMGSHFEYSLRYPAAFDKFKLTDGIAANPAETMNAHYDNSVLYTDYLLSEMLKIVDAKKTSAMVAYFSDHGVDSSVGAYPSSNASRRSEYAYRVPLFFWFSEALKEQRQEQWQSLRLHVNEPYTTRAMYPTLLEISGIEFPGSSPSASVFQVPNLKTNPRLVAGAGQKMMNFDIARSKNKCFLAP
jgi:glucan phosphoethanolaminetransferase (alkaline phosphatase superfamily)